MFQLANCLMYTVSMVLQDKSSIMNTSTTRSQVTVNDSQYEMAYSLINTELSKVESTCIGVKPVPICEVYTNSPFIERKKADALKKLKAIHTLD